MHIKEDLEDLSIKPNDLYDWYIDPLLSVSKNDKINIKLALLRCHQTSVLKGLHAGKRLEQIKYNNLLNRLEERLKENNIKV